MRGTVLGFDAETGEGVISGNDGQRYNFSSLSVQSNPETVRPGVPVDFETDGGRAVSIFQILSQGGQVGQKSKLVAGLLAIFLGTFGIHKFYLGRTGPGLIMLACTLLGWILLFIPTFLIGIIAFVEGIIYLVKSDEDFYQQYEVDGKGWF